MNILMIHHRLPYPLHSGMDKVRYHLIRSLMTRHNVTLVAPITPKNSRDDIEHVRQICSDFVPVSISKRRLRWRKSRLFTLWRWFCLVALRRPFYTQTEYFPEVSRTIRTLCRDRQYDVVQVTSNIASRYLTAIRGHAKVVMGPMDDYVEAARTNRMYATSFKSRLAWQLRLRARLYYEPKMCRLCDRVFFHSPEDLERFSKVVGGLGNARILWTVVEDDSGMIFDTDEAAEREEANSIVFVGGLGSAFNVDAVQHFHADILPKIWERIPDAHFYIVGNNPPKCIKVMTRDPRVTVTGFVPDVRPYVERAAVYVAPVRAGTGFKTKIVEALSLGKAIVALPLGVQGLWDLGDDVVRVVEDAEHFSHAVVSLLLNEQLRQEHARKARILFESTYAFVRVTPHVLRQYEDI